jgi:hypothetical protein
MIPSGDKVTIILASNSTSWGSYAYDEKEDVLRVDVSPTDASYARVVKI